MRSLLATTILTTSIGIAHATTINATIEADKTFAARSLEFLKDRSQFPYKHYESVTVTTKKIDSSDPQLRKFDSIVFDVSLDLISYDKDSDIYKFKIYFKPKITLAQDYKAVGKMNAVTYFKNTLDDSMEISGKFNRNINKNEFPKGNLSDSKDFMLSVSNMGELYITTQHPIPVVIKIS